MLFYRFLFSWAFSLILNCFSPMVADEAMLNIEPADQIEQKKSKPTNS